jgi:two-component system chemotaxis response regulator CheY
MTYEFENISAMVIDDMTPMLTLVTSLLDIFGFGEIITATDSDDAFEKFQRQSPDLVLTDWLGFSGNGLETIRQIRRDPNSPNRFAPVVMMTGFSHPVRVEQARDQGINDFMVKPFKLPDLTRRIEQIVEKPRKFIENERFFGPDRRRHKKDSVLSRRDADLPISSRASRPTGRFAVHEPPNILRQKIGQGGFDPVLLQKAENYILHNKIDFLPIGQAMAGHIDLLIADIMRNPENKRDIITKIMMAVMKIKANAGMFGHALSEEISSIVLVFLETVRMLDRDVADVLRAYTAALKILLNDGHDHQVTSAMAIELQNACLRYYKKHGIET